MNCKNERMTPSTMKAIVINKITSASAAKLSVIEVPRVKPGWLLVRGGSCALGYAAVQIAHALGCKVAATVRSARHRDLLERLGCAYVLEDDGALSAKGLKPTKVLELVGTKTLLDSLKTAAHGGVVCHTGILGGEEPLRAFSPLADIPNGGALGRFSQQLAKPENGR